MLVRGRVESVLAGAAGDPHAGAHQPRQEHCTILRRLPGNQPTYAGHGVHGGACNPCALSTMMLHGAYHPDTECSLLLRVMLLYLSPATTLEQYAMWFLCCILMHSTVHITERHA